MLEILQKEKCQQPTGPTESSGDDLIFIYWE